VKRVFSILFALVLGVSLGLVTATPVLADVIHVPGDYATIQAAINAAGPGDTIMVAAGEYDAFMVQGKTNISIIGAEGATVTTANRFAVDIRPITGEVWVMAGVNASENVNIDCIDFDGTKLSKGETAVGIAYVDSTGRIADLTVENIPSSGWYVGGVAIIGDVGTSVVDVSCVAVENSFAGVAIWNAEADLDGCRITGMSLAGILTGLPVEPAVGPSTANIQGSTISNNRGGIYVSEDSALEAHFNNIVGNAEFGVANDGREIVDATYNWWGDASGPYHGTLNPHGTGDAVSDNVDFEPWLEAEAVTETVTNSTVDAREEADTEVAVIGRGTVTVARYDENPGGAAPTGFNPLGKYIDVHVPYTREVTEVEIRLYYTDDEVQNSGEESLRLFWWNGEGWVPCSPDAASGVNTATTEGYSGYMWAKITATTTPSLADLQGTPWGGYGHPTEKGICFIATAAYGTDTAKEIDILREFRETVLLPSSLGGKFVSFYCRTSPPVADFISQHEVLRTAVRVGFVAPIVKILKWTHDLWSARDSQ
jgi:hypothetical protein